MSEGGDYTDYLLGDNSPAAPEGARQMETQTRGGQENKLTSWLMGEGNGGRGQQGYAGGAQSWLTGANQDGVNNGWDTGFVDTFQKQWDEALSSGNARTYYEQEDATGVVLWDHTSSDGKTDFHFGDVYEGGQLKHNLYDVYDNFTANLMIQPWIPDQKPFAEAFASSDVEGSVDREMKKFQETQNETFEESLKQLEFQGDVEQREEFFREGIVDEGIVVAATAGSAALGAGVGSVVPGLGTAVGAVTFGVAGGLGAFFNRDALTEQAARAYEVTKMSYDDNNFAAGTMTGLTQFAGFSGKLISPFSNLTQGIYDVTAGKGGDGKSEFYETDEQGRNQAPGWVKVADVAAVVTDSLVQFSNPIGLGLYTASMGGVVAGEVGELVFTGGKSFDYRTASFDNIFTDDDGNFDASSAAAGIGKVGIDAVQLGVARGLAGRANALRADVGESAAYGTFKLPTWLGGSPKLAAGETRVRAGGMSMTKDASGKIVDGTMRPTLGLLAPSEQIAALGARVEGMRAAARAGGAYTADDFYKAANAMATGDRKIVHALVNSFGEGYEEAIQAVLEPHSHGGALDANEIINNAVYGAASGFGMSMGMNARTPSADKRMFSIAQQAEWQQTGAVTLTEAEWKGLPDIEKRRRAAQGELNNEMARAAFRKIHADQAKERYVGVAGTQKVEDAIASKMAQDLARAGGAPGGAFVISQLETVPRLDAAGNLLPGEIPVNAVVGSAIQTARNMVAAAQGRAVAHDELTARLEEANAALAANPENTDAQAEAARRVEQVEASELTLRWGQQIDQMVDSYIATVRTTLETTDNSAQALPQITADTAVFNELLRKGFDMELDALGPVALETDADRKALARAIGQVFGRDPHDQSGSFQVLLPQVSPRLTAEEADNVLEIGHPVLPSISGDYDGDKVRLLNQLIFDEAEYAALRTGTQFMGAGTSVNVGAPKQEVEHIEFLAEALGDSTNPTTQDFATETLNRIGVAVKTRYADAVDLDVLDGVLAEFYAQVRANNKDARQYLLDGLASRAGKQITEFNTRGWSNEWLWLDQLVVSSFQQFQGDYAAHRPALDPATDDAARTGRRRVRPVAQSTTARTRREMERATLGQTLAALIPGDSLFRKFQDLHYSSINAPVLSAEGVERSTVADMANFYRELAQLTNLTELEVLRSKDQITGRVLAQLNALAADFSKLNPQLNRHEAMLVVANTAVSNIDIDEQGNASDLGTKVSLAQMLLKQSVIQDQREKARILEASPELQAKHARLMGMTLPGSKTGNAIGAEQAFIEIMGAQQFYALLGDAAGPFGPHLTVEQFVRMFSSMSEIDRRDMSQKLRLNNPEYVGNTAKTRDMPYALSDVIDGNVSAYRSVVDAVLAAGAARITMDTDTGVLTGEFKQRSDIVAENFQVAHGQVRTALQEYLGMVGRADGQLTVDVIGDLLEGNPDFARKVMNLIPNAAAQAAFQIRNGEAYAANWLYELFAEPDAKLAEMSYWRNLLLTQWFAKGDVAVAEEGDEGHHPREYARLDRRVHRIMYNLAAQDDGGLLYQEFVRQLESATDLNEFVRWMNQHPGIRGNTAPIVPWFDDVAEFDADKAGGGWTAVLAGAELRESIQMLRAGAETLVQSMREERVSMAADLRTRAAIRRAAAAKRGEKVTLDPNDKVLYDRLQGAIDLAEHRYVAAGPRAMLNQIMGAAIGFQAMSHTKGINPANVTMAGQLDSTRDAYDFTLNYERLMSSMTAVNLNAVGANMSLVAKDAGRSMDDYGRQVVWTKPTVEEILDQLEDPIKRPLARAVLFPQVMERDANNVLRPQLLVGKGLTDLLDGYSFKQIIPAEGQKLSQDSAFRYLSLIEGMSRKYKGHFSVQRALNDIVIARTAAADHKLSAYELEQMATKAMLEVAQVLQQVGSIMSRETSPGGDPLAGIRDLVTDTQRRMRTARFLGLSTAEDQEISDLVIDQFIDGHNIQIAEEIAAADAEQVLALTEQSERFLKHVELLRTSDPVGMAVDMFTIDGDPMEQSETKNAILEFVRHNMGMMELSVASAFTLTKLTRQWSDKSREGQVDLTDDQWTELSLAVIGVYLDGATTGGTISPYPDAKHPRDQKYFDTSWSYLVLDLLDPQGPLAQAARDAHIAAGRLGDEPVKDSDFYFTLGNTLLDGQRLGPHTNDVVTASIEANSRLDSSAAAPAIAMAGNSPKRYAAILAALRRTFLTPPEELSVVRLGVDQLDADLFSEVQVTLPGVAEPVLRPLAQLNNRFARTATFTYTDAAGAEQAIDLMPKAGMPWMRERAVRESDYQEIHLDRLKVAAEDAALKAGVHPGAGTITVEFLHPDTQPANEKNAAGQTTKNWYNNVFYEGTSFKLDADRAESLVATLLFSPGGVSQTAQRSALDASKLGIAALQEIETVTAADLEVLEANAMTDLGAVLRAKTRIMLTTDLGTGVLDPEFYNAVYKEMKVRHFVKGLNPETNKVELMTAEDVIRLQLAGQPVPLEGAALWIPTDDVLRSMLGEQGTQGVDRVFDDTLEIDPSRIPIYSGVSAKMLARFGDGAAAEVVGLADTKVMHRAKESQFQVRAMLDISTKEAHDAKLLYFHEREQEIHLARAEQKGFDAPGRYRGTVEKSKEMLSAEDLSIFWTSIGIPFGPRNPADRGVTEMLLRDLQNLMTETNDYRTGHIYREGSGSKQKAGIISEISLGNNVPPSYRISPKDLVAVELDSFTGPTAKDVAKERLTYMANQGAIILLGDTKGSSDLRYELSEFLQSDLQYERVAGSKHAYQPIQRNSRYQNQRAKASTLLAMEEVTGKNRAAVFSVEGREIQEGAAWAVPGDDNLGAIGVTANLVPTGAFGNFNVPVESLSNTGQIEAVRTKLRDLDNPLGRAHLLRQATAHLRDKNGVVKKAKAKQLALVEADFELAFRRMMNRFNDHQGTVLPQAGDEFGAGDLIPLIDTVGNVLLYAHGMKAPRRDQIAEMTSRTLGDSADAEGIAVFPWVPEAAATTAAPGTATVVEFRHRSGYGLEVELNVPLQLFGDKKQLQWNGMKYVVIPKPDSIVLPEHGFFPKWAINLVSDRRTLHSKEAVADQVDNFRNAFAFLGMDFIGDVTEFFFPGEGAVPEKQTITREMLHTIARTTSIPVETAQELMQFERLGSTLGPLLEAQLTTVVDGINPAWIDRVSTDATTVEAEIATAAIIYLMTPGARVSDIIKSGGLNHPDSRDEKRKSQKMPRLFTQKFDNALLDSPLRVELFNRLNDQLHNPAGTRYRLMQNWDFEVRNPADPKTNLIGRLAFPEMHSAGDNPIKSGVSFDENERSTVSFHSAAIAYGAVGAETPIVHDIAKARLFAEGFHTGEGVPTFERDKIDGGAWRALRAIPKEDSSFPYWKSQTPAEALRRDLAREAMVQFRQPLVMSEALGWSPNQERDYQTLAGKVVRTLGLLDGQTELVDFWVRQVLGQNQDPRSLDNEGRVTGRAALQAAEDILWAVENHYLPTVSAEVPLMHLHDLQLIYTANQHKPNPWNPRSSIGKDAAKVTDWAGWTEVSLGSALTSDNRFDPLYLLALDGLMHTYQNATRSLMDLPVSLDVLKAMDLMDPGLSRMLVSISDQENTKAEDPMVLNAERATLTEVVGGYRISGKFEAKHSPAHAVAQRRAHIRKYREENGVPIPVDTSMRNLRKNGAQFVDQGTKTNAFLRILMQMRLGTALINPALYISMGPEQWIRGALDRTANIITGQATTGVIARTQAKVSSAVQGSRLGEAATQLGFETRYTPEQLTQLNQLYQILGQRHDFIGMIYKDLNFDNPLGMEAGKIERLANRFGRLGTAMQDPTYGMLQATTARRYLEAAMQHLASTPTRNVLSTESLIANLTTDPMFLQKHHREVHQAALNAVMQIRSMKQTVAGSFVKGIVNPIADSQHPGVNVVGHLLLKIPLLFSNYAANVATSILGLQGLDQMTAAFLHGRQKGPSNIWGRISAKIQGVPLPPEADANFDFSSVLEGIDLSRAFLRGGLTHAGLFAFGMYAGGLGLGGEDDEMRKRRLLSENQGVGNLADPRRIENDFRNVDAIYLDALPLGLGNIFEKDPETGRAMADLNWTLKQFISPIMGMEMFFQTGDFRHVTWGFQDALGAFPLVNAQMWHDVVSTGQMMAEDAEALAKSEDPNDHIESMGMFTRIVGTYERMLVESSFLSAIYVGADEWDRDPYKLVLRDSDGTIQRDIQGNARPQNIALSMFTDPVTGEVGSGYLTRDGLDKNLHVLTENRPVLAAALAIASGDFFQSDYIRFNMPIKEKVIEKTPVSLDAADSLLRGAGYAAMQNQPLITVQEILPQIRNEMIALGKATGKYYVDADFHREARNYIKAMEAQQGKLGASLIAGVTDADLGGADRELVGEMRGLMSGQLQLNSQELGDMFLSYEDREKLAAKWSKEIYKEGIELGLDETQAAKRVTRIMVGPYDNPTVRGLGDLLWDNQEGLSYEKSTTYRQQNTSVVMGPDGMPWSTGMGRGGFLTAMGLKPFKRPMETGSDEVGKDSRGNTVNLLTGTNTGLRALVPVHDSINPLTDAEIAEKLGKVIEDAIKGIPTPYTPIDFGDDKKGSGWVNYGGYGGYGGGGGGGGGGSAYFTKMYALPNNIAPYGNDISFINTGNPIIRRTTVRRERVWSERGRLKQWQ